MMCCCWPFSDVWLEDPPPQKKKEEEELKYIYVGDGEGAYYPVNSLLHLSPFIFNL